MKAEDINYMDIEELSEGGYLHELNRQFLHPLGLALEISIDENGKYTLSGVWDYRDDPEGITFGKLSYDKMEKIKTEWDSRKPDRIKLLGTMIQEDNR